MTGIFMHAPSSQLPSFLNLYRLMLHSRRSLLLSALVAVLVLGGCRTYGGYDTQPKTYQALQNAVQSFEQELGRAQADLEALQGAAAQSDTLQALAERLKTHVDEHESLLETQRERIQDLSPESSYRALHTAYGATVTEQRMTKQKYQRVIRSVRGVVQGTPMTTAAATPKTDRQYTIRPINFPKLQEQPPLTMEQALQGR